MKKVRMFSIGLGAAFLLLLTACKGEEKKVVETLSVVGSKDFSLTPGAQTVSLSFRTSCAWQLVIPTDAPWITANPISGSKQSSSKYYTVNLSVQDNGTESKRSANLRIEYGTQGKVMPISVTQVSSGGMKPIGVDRITQDMLFSTVPAATSTAVQQGFDFDEGARTIYFSQVNSGFKNIIGWTSRQQLTTSTALCSNKMSLMYFSHGNNIHYEKGSDGSDYIWIANYGTRDSEDKYTNPQILSRVKLVAGSTLKNTETTDNYYFGTKTIHASFDVKNDHIAIFSQADGYQLKIFKLSEVLAVPESEITLPVSLTYGGGTSKKAPDAEWTGRPKVKCHDCSHLTPVGTFTYNYTSVRGWQTFCISGDKVYFFLFYKATNPAANGMYYKSVIDIFDFNGKMIKSDITQPFAENMEDLKSYGFTDDATKYMENEGILIRDGVLYLLYTGKNAVGFRRPIVFQLDASSLD